jgi:hypothetical protein
MTYKTFACCVMVAACAAWPAVSFAQASRTDKASAPSHYDATSETTVSGTITQVVSVAGADGTIGVHFNLKTDAGPVRVHVGPALFIGESNFWFQIDDPVVITGAKVQKDGEIGFWARTVKKEDGKTLELRTADGAPLWKGEPADADGCGVSHLVVR